MSGSMPGVATFLALSEGLDARSGPEGRVWRRTELHERGGEGSGGAADPREGRTADGAAGPGAS